MLPCVRGASVEVADFRDMITFARTYADKHHHGKEEQILFREMMERLGPTAVNLIQHGMFVEHDMGRFHIGELEQALERYEATQNTTDKMKNWDSLLWTFGTLHGTTKNERYLTRYDYFFL